MNSRSVPRRGRTVAKALITLVLIGWTTSSRAITASPGGQDPGGEAQASKSVGESRRRYEQALEAARRQATEELRQREERAAREERARVERLRSGALWALGVLSAVGIGALGVLSAVGIVIFLQRHWLWPAVRVPVAPGQHVQVKAPWSQKAEPGVILETLWAKNRWGRRQRIKVETFAGGDETDDYAFFSSGSSRPMNLDVLVTAGVSVPKGTYLAVGRNGAVRIDVRRTPPGDVPGITRHGRA